jgi:hypothetical protein
LTQLDHQVSTQLAERRGAAAKRGEVARMKVRKITLNAALSLCALLLPACVVTPEGEKPARTQSSPAPRLPLIAYLHEGHLWVVQADGAGARLLARAPEGEAINHYVWSRDGSRCYFFIGPQLFAVSLSDGKVVEAGEMALPPEAAIDRLELGRDGATLLAHVLGAGAAPKPFALRVGQREAQELTVDEYQALAQPPPLVVRSFTDLAVSPDGRHLLFKEAVGNDEQLFVSDVETGARHQVSALGALSGFEESALRDGGRHLLEAAWSPDSRHVIFNPAQSCSELGLCYGRLFLAEVWGGTQLPLAREMMVNIPLEWNRAGTLLVYDDGGQVLLADTRGQIRRLGEGLRPKWQPGDE